MLEKINSPADIKNFSDEQFARLAEEIRAEIIGTVSENGGHLSSNLGVVEVTLALHKIFDVPGDKIFFDVSHQSYAHKLLTGRYQNFSTLRQKDGISGFANPKESDCDPMYQGHCGTSVSEALAFAVTQKLKGGNACAVAVVGDGAFTNGMIYEALNNCADKNVNLVILLNDNEMSISENIGGLNRSLRRMRSSAGYFRFKHGLKRFLKKIPLLGNAALFVGRKLKDAVKNAVLKKNVFENLGLEYIGPVDGNDFRQTSSALAEAKTMQRCCVVHVYTKKGLGYAPAQAEPAKYHAVGPFDPKKGVGAGGENFSLRFGRFIDAAADRGDKICAITAAMGAGCGLSDFADHHPDRFFDVGIAEEHAVTFGAGLAAAGMTPVCAIYSTFAQRVFDQLFQDVTLSKVHFVFALDRCGLVEGDGITHQGLYDYPLFTALPYVTIYSPATYAELDMCLGNALGAEGLQIVRYPKGEEVRGGWEYTQNKDIAYTTGTESARTVIVTYGRIADNARDIGVGIVRLVKVFPIDFDMIDNLTRAAENIILLEEGMYEGGMAQKSEAHFVGLGKKVITRAVHGFVLHGSLKELYGSCGFLPDQLKSLIPKE